MSLYVTVITIHFSVDVGNFYLRLKCIKVTPLVALHAKFLHIRYIQPTTQLVIQIKSCEIENSHYKSTIMLEFSIQYFFILVWQ